MRKLKLQVQMSVDGFVGGPNGELDWLFPFLGPAQVECVTEFLREADTMLIGRVSYLQQIAYWSAKTAPGPLGKYQAKFGDAGDEMSALLDEIAKVVFSRTLERLDWSNSRFATADVAEEVTRLKQQPGKNIIVRGSATLVHDLIPLRLIDEYNLVVHPIALGRGIPLFGESSGHVKLRLVATKTFDSGALLLTYQGV